MNLKEIREIINLMNENGLMEVEIEREGAKVKLKKTSGESAQVYHAPIAAPIASAAVAKASGEDTVTVNVNHREIKSPMVGTFYAAPAPDADPFVTIGQIVNVGQVVGIVEAMKLMNEIKSEVKGKIVEASIENAQPVEFGQALFVVESV